MNVFVEYFNHQNIERKKEIDETLSLNISFGFINNFYVFSNNNDSNEIQKLNHNGKIKNIIVENRCTFQSVFDFANTISGKEDINITMNNDIMLSEGFKNIKIPKECFFAISRWEKNTARPFCYRTCDSQDLWVWKGINNIKNCNFYFGLLGCDNKLAHIAEENGYITRNPSYSYKCYHNHASQIRIDSSNKALRLPGPYKKVCPCH